MPIEDCYGSVGDVTFYHRDGKCFYKDRIRPDFPGTMRQMEQQQGDTLLVHVVRNLADLFRGELEVMADIMLDRFEDSLLVDSHTQSNLEPEFATMHSELLDQLLDQAPDIIIKGRMAAVRENDRVVVYNM